MRRSISRCADSRFGAIASISSMKRIAGATAAASANSCRSFASLSPAGGRGSRDCESGTLRVEPSYPAPYCTFAPRSTRMVTVPPPLHCLRNRGMRYATCMGTPLPRHDAAPLPPPPGFALPLFCIMPLSQVASCNWQWPAPVAWVTWHREHSRTGGEGDTHSWRGVGSRHACHAAVTSYHCTD